MKCEQVQKWILREDAGELARWQRAAMEQHLTGCSECRHFRFDLHQIAESTVVMEQPPMDRFAMQMLVNEARRVQAKRAVPSLGRTLREFFQPLATPSLALRLVAVTTVALLLLSGSVALLRSSSAPQRVAWDDGVDQQLSYLQDTLATLDAEAAHTGNGDVEAIARQLLEVEG
jgi:hypothetical protein